MKQLTTSGYQSPTVQDLGLIDNLPLADSSGIQLGDFDEVQENW